MCRCNAGLENFNSLAIELGFDMLSEMPAIIARRTSFPPRCCARLQTASVFLDYVRQPYDATLVKIFNSVPRVVQQLANS